MNDYSETRGVGLLIHYPRMNMSCLQQKVGHPIARLNGKLCLWGGGVHEGELPREALEREIREEFSERIAELLLNYWIRSVEEVYRVNYHHPLARGLVIKNMNWVIRLSEFEWRELTYELRSSGSVLEGRARILRTDPCTLDDYEFLPSQREFIERVLR